MKRVLVAFAFVFVAACNNPTGVGMPCTVTADCEGGHSCSTDAPGGFCTRGCTFEGKTTDCPGGSVCTFVGGTSLVCAPICAAQTDCRDQYECNGVTGSELKACKPKK